MFFYTVKRSKQSMPGTWGAKNGSSGRTRKAGLAGNDGVEGLSVTIIEILLGPQELITNVVVPYS